MTLSKEELKNLFFDVKFRFLDPNDPEIIKAIQQTNQEQQKVLDRKKIDWDNFSKIYITI